MIYRSPPEDRVFPGPVRGPGPAEPHAFQSRAKDRNPRGGDVRWSLRRMVLSTVSVNALIWAAAIFVFWWAVTR